MKFIFCPKCGKRLEMRIIGDEGEIPFCEECSIPYFNNPAVCVICLVINEYNELALIKQNYVDGGQRYICVAGYITNGEKAEDAAAREIYEEIGQKAVSVEYVGSYPYNAKEQLMLGYAVKVTKTDFSFSDEVDNAKWFSFADACRELKKGSIINLLIDDYAKMKGIKLENA